MKVPGNEMLSPGEIAVQDLAASPYKDQRYVKGLMKIFEQISPRVSDEDIVEFCKYWADKSNNEGKFPYRKHVKWFMDHLPSREVSVEEVICSADICDGEGHIEIRAISNHNTIYIWRDGCKCIDESKFEQTMNTGWELTEWQQNYTTVKRELSEGKKTKNVGKLIDKYIDDQCPF